MSDLDPPQEPEQGRSVPPAPPAPPQGDQEEQRGPWAPPYASIYGSTEASTPPPPPPPPPPWGQAQGAATPDAPPTWPATGGGGSPGWPPQAPGWPPQGGPGGGGPGGTAVSNPSATAALVLGITGIVAFWALGLGILLGVLAVIFGAIGMRRANGLPGQFRRGRAKAGLLTGIAAVILGIGFLLVAVAAFDEVNVDPADGVCDEDRFIQDPDC